jgi:hypothetical protein
MLRKKPDMRHGTMEEVGRDLQCLYEALRRTHGRSALVPPTPVVLSDEQRARAREIHVRARTLLDGNRLSEALSAAHEALALDPGVDDAAEVAWRATRRLHDQSRPRVLDAAAEARVQALLARAAPGKGEPESRGALAELALIAPDDPRLIDLLRARAGKE